MSTEPSTLSDDIISLHQQATTLSDHLLQAGDRLTRRDTELAADQRELRWHINRLRTSGADPFVAKAQQADPVSVPTKDRYQFAITHILQLMKLISPVGCMVAVASKGDDKLLAFDGRTGCHLPYDKRTGGYAGHHPAHGAAAVEYLEAVRALGATFLVLPWTAFWWLEKYPQFATHLEAEYRRIHLDEYCMVYSLSKSKSNGSGQGHLRRFFGGAK